MNLAGVSIGLMFTVMLSACGGGSSDSGTMPQPLGPPGTPDVSFGSGGTVFTPIGVDAAANAAVLQSDGKIIAVGYANDGTNRNFAAARYNPDGTLDSSFGQGGKVITPLGANQSVALSVALQSDGKVIAAGYTGYASHGNASYSNCALLRYNRDGTIDQSFGSAGAVLAAEYGCSAVTVQSDNKIVAAAFGIGAVRLNADGTRDLSFGSAGAASVVPPPGTPYTYAIAIQPDGKIVVGGWSEVSNFAVVGTYVLARFDTDGKPDPDFGSAGVATIAGCDPRATSPSAGGLVVQPDGKIIVEACNQVFRRLIDGAPDPGFGTGGAVATPGGTAVALQTDNKIVVTGGVPVPGSSPPPLFALLRLLPDGTADSGFGSGGTVARVFTALAIAVQSDQRIVIAGGSADAALSYSRFGLARYFGN